MGVFDWDNYKELLRYYCKDNYQQYENKMSVEDKSGFHLLERQTEHLCELIVDAFGIDTDEYKVKPHLKQGGISKTPWIEINNAHGSNANGENSYYVALIYSSRNDALLMNVTISATYLHDQGKNAKEIDSITKTLKRKIEEQYDSISFENINYINKPVTDNKNENDVSNLYLQSSVFYAYVKFDLSNIDWIIHKAYELYGIWDTTNEDIKLTDFYNSINLETYNIKAEAAKREAKVAEEIRDKYKDIQYLTKTYHATGKAKKAELAEEQKESKISRAKAKRIREKQAKLGDLAEDLIVEMEKRTLIQAGKQDLADKVTKLDTDGDGYDVDSFYPDGRRKKIEVKSNSSNSYDFYVSDNELNKILNNKDIEVYFVKNPNKEGTEVIRVEMDPDKSHYTPVSYVATAKK